MTGELNLTATFHRPIFQAMGTPQQAYVLLEIVPNAGASGAGSQPVNFCLVLDRSGSMAGEKLHFMKEAAKRIVDRLGPQDLLSIAIFDDSVPADLVFPNGAVLDRDMLKHKIDSIQERGGTHMSSGMRLGLQELQRGQSPDRISSMLLLTDGQTWEDQAECRALADQFRSAGIPMVVLGLGVGGESNWDPLLLEDLAQRSGGEWIAVDSTEKVGLVFEKTLRAVQGAAVTNACLTMRLVEGVTARFVWRVAPLISRLGPQAVSMHDIQFFLGDIQQSAGQSVLADLLLPPRASGAYRIIQADIVYNVPGSGLGSQKTSIDGVATFTEDPSQASQTDARLMNIIERVIAHKLQTQALDEAAAGEMAKATQRLRAAATRLLELGETELAQQANQQAQHIEQSGQLDLAAAQKMRYATKRLTELDSS